jgi:hypothetical protein
MSEFISLYPTSNYFNSKKVPGFRLGGCGTYVLSECESPSLVLVINDTKLLMTYVKLFELGISNTRDEGACGMK